MKYLKFLLINIVVFGGLLFGISLLFPSSSTVTKSINATTTKLSCQQILLDTANWKNWNSLAFQQPQAITIQLQNADTITTISCTNNQNRIKDSYLIYATDSLQTTITWRKTEALKWYAPFAKFRAMVTNKQIAAEMDSSLNRLKLVIEKH